MLLPYILASKTHRNLRSSFDVLKLQAISAIVNSAQDSKETSNSSLVSEIKILRTENFELKSEIEGFTEKLQNYIKDNQSLSHLLKEKETECQSLARNVQNHLSELEIYENKTLTERSLLNKENTDLQSQNSHLSEENYFLKSEFENIHKKLQEYEDERQGNMLQNAQLKGQIKKIQDMYNSLQAEKTKLQSSEIEQRKQIISLTTTIDSFGEDKQNFYQKLSKANESITQLQDQLSQYVQRNDHMSSNLQFYINQEKELHKELEELQDEITEKSNLLYQKENEVLKLAEIIETNKAQMLKYKKETENLQQNHETSKVKHLTKENQLLNQRIEEIQKINDKKINKEINELRCEAGEFKELAQQAANDNSLLQKELEIVTKDLTRIQQERDQLLQAIKEKQTFHHQKSESQVQSLRDYCNNLEQKVQNLQNSLSKSKKHENEYMTIKEMNADLQDKNDKLQAELEEVNEVAITSRKEIALVTAEIENYANIFTIMEEKIAETEDLLKQAEQERDHAISEIKAVRQRYINIIAEAR